MIQVAPYEIIEYADDHLLTYAATGTHNIYHFTSVNLLHSEQFCMFFFYTLMYNDNVTVYLIYLPLVNYLYS